MKRQLVTAVAAALSLGLAACGGAETPAETDGGTTADNSGKTLTVWIMEGTNPDATAFFEDVEAGFTEETGANLDVQMVPWASAKDKFATAMAGGTGPDVAEVGTTWTPEFAEAGALMDVTEQAAEAGLDDGMVESLINAGTYDGGLYGVPWYAGIRSVLYNKEIFAEAGIEETPTTWAEFTDVIDKIKASQPDVIPFPVLGASEFATYPFIWGAGGEIAEQEGDGWTSTIDSPESREGLTYLTDLKTEHDASTPAADTWNEKDALTAFQQGDVAMVIAGNWTPGTVKQNSPDLYEQLGAFPIPSKDGGPAGSFVGGSHLSVFEQSENKDLAWQFVEMMTTGKFASQWGEESGFLPGQVDALDKILDSGDELEVPFATQMKEAGKTVPATPSFAAIQGQKVVPTMMQAILTGKASVDEATTTAAQTMNDAFSG